MASRQEEPEEYEEEEYEEDFMNQIGIGVERVLYGITWIFEGVFILFVVAILAGIIWG
tara:strand:- start:523 stop:696 length:174 start_codon:yes stop_codon:yes gene_type:complete